MKHYGMQAKLRLSASGKSRHANRTDECPLSGLKRPSLCDQKEWPYAYVDLVIDWQSGRNVEPNLTFIVATAFQR
jgi:hypothetical protein